MLWEACQSQGVDGWWAWFHAHLLPWFFILGKHQPSGAGCEALWMFPNSYTCGCAVPGFSYPSSVSAKTLEEIMTSKVPVFVLPLHLPHRLGDPNGFFLAPEHEFLLLTFRLGFILRKHSKVALIAASFPLGRRFFHLGHKKWQTAEGILCSYIATLSET